MLRRLTLFASAALMLAVGASASFGQGTPSPQTGPTNPTSPSDNPQAQPGATIIINPTFHECQQGWNSSMKWSKEQFDKFCTMLKASK
jgi:hypothetical protein